jgi:hypothetical protein
MIESTAMIVPQQSLVSALIALQFVAFGWRLNREITVGDRGSKTWLSLPDYLNLLSLLAVVSCCVVTPLARGTNSRVAGVILGVSYVLIAFHPISEAAHYRLFSKGGRAIYLNTPNGDYPWITGQEVLTVIVSVVFATLAGCVVWHA